VVFGPPAGPQPHEFERFCAAKDLMNATTVDAPGLKSPLHEMLR
jgi:hypothetical protein